MSKVKFGEIAITPKRLIEASFNSSQLSKVTSLYGKLLSKEFGSSKDFICISDETFKSGNRKGRGLRFMNIDGYQIRMNFSERKNKFSNREQFVVSSMDYWDPKDFSTFDKPTKTVLFSSELNVVMILKKILNALKAGENGTIKLHEGFEYEALVKSQSLNEEYELSEKAGDPGWAKYLGSPEMRMAFAKKMGWENPEQYGLKGNDKKFNFMLGQFNYRVAPKWEWEEEWGERPDKDNFSKEWVEYIAEIKPGSPESNSLQEDLDKQTKVLEQAVNNGYANPEYIFQDLEKILKVIANKDFKVLIIAGDPGLGKTFRVKDYLKKAIGRLGFEVVPAPKFSIEELYQYLLTNYDKVVMFDEAEKLLQNESTKNFFKTLLDTSTESGGTLVTLMTNNLRCPNDPEWISAYTKILSDSLRGENPVSIVRGKQVSSSYADLRTIEPSKLKRFTAEDLTPMLDANQPNKEGDEVKHWLPLPNAFIFKGSCIFITNEKLSNIDTAIISRAFAMDLSFSSVDKWRIMAEIDSIENKKTIRESSELMAKLAKIQGLNLKIGEDGRIEKDPNVVYRETYGIGLVSTRIITKIRLLEKYFGEDEAITLTQRYGF